jgi:hypothetical protein
MSPLAEAVYEILRRRTALPNARLSYADLAAQLRKRSRRFSAINHRSRALYSALTEIGEECRRLGLPPLPSLVVRADTRRPGSAYFEGKCAGIVTAADKIAVWWDNVQAVQGTTYPARG